MLNLFVENNYAQTASLSNEFLFRHNNVTRMRQLYSLGVDYFVLAVNERVPTSKFARKEIFLFCQQNEFSRNIE